jgi:hypothetical protein
MFRDFSDGDLGNPFSGYGMQATCYLCKANVRCASECIRSVQWPLHSGQAPPRSEYANRVPRKYQEDLESRPISGPLHHYTSLDALLSILKTRSLWATNIRYLNDSSESELGLKLMRQVAEEARATSRGIDSDILSYLIEWLDSPRSEAASVYVLSFSEAHNQLSQWRGYTTYGQGVCISLGSDHLVRRMQAQGWTFQNCRYNPASQLTWAEAILSRIRREAATTYTGVEAEKKSCFTAVLQNCLSALLQVAATIKHGAFAQEREVRFVSPLISIADHKIRYRRGRTTQVPYVEFSLAEGDDDLVIQEIMVGPSPRQQGMQTSITNALEQARVLSRGVTVCSIPYREV